MSEADHKKRSLLKAEFPVDVEFLPAELSNFNRAGKVAGRFRDPACSGFQDAPIEAQFTQLLRLG